MANRQLSPVSYNRFDPQPTLADGLLPVNRETSAELDQKVAAGLANLAMGVQQKLDVEAQKQGTIAGQQAALNARAGGLVKGGEMTTASPNGQAGHIAGASGVAGGRGARVAPPELSAIIRGAAAKYGVDGAALEQIAGIESSFNPHGPDSSAGAKGLFQFVGSTARQYGLADPYDPAQASDAAARLMRDNADSLRKALGRDPTAGELYLAHQQGAGGASALLRNPDAMAVDVVGRDAVVGNGGSAGMTAGEFAKLWTSRVTGGAPGSYSTLPADTTGPVSVVQVQRPVSIDAGSKEGFRPMPTSTFGNNTYADAYNAAGQRTYLQDLQMTMLDEQDKLAQAYKGNPAGLEKAMGELLQAHLADHVFPEIAGDYQLAFRKAALSHVMQARDEAEKIARENYRVSLTDRIGQAEDQKARILAGTDFTEAASNRLHLIQRTIDDQYDAQVSQQLMTPQQAATAKKASRDQLSVDFYLGQTRTMKPAEIATMREHMRSDFAEGKLDVSADAWDKIEAGLLSEQQKRTTQNNALTQSLQRRSKDMAQRLAGGGTVTPDEIAKFQADAAAVEGGKDIAKSALTRLQIGQALRQLPIGEAKAQIAKMLQNGSAEDIKFGQEQVKLQEKALSDDPIGMAERLGVLSPSPGLPLDGQVNASSVASSFHQRIADAEAAAKHFGVEPVYFKPGEADQIEAAVKADPARGLQIAAGLVSAAGKDAPRVLRELGKDAPAVSLAGGLVAAGGDQKAAADILAGFGKTPDGNNYADMPVTKRMPLAQAQAGSALVFTPDAVVQTDAAAAAIARKRLHDAGIDPKKEEAQPIYERAYQEAAGAIFNGNVQFGGFADYRPGWNWKSRKVLVDNRIRADKLSDVIGALTDADIGTVKAKNGKTWSAKDIQGAMPVAVKGGYAFALGDPATSPMFIADEKGNPVVIDIAGMGDRLKARVPGAFR